MRRLIFAAALLTVFNLQAFTIAENGVAKAVIVIPEKSGAAEKYAAGELKYHLQKISGAKFDIVAESSKPAGKNFIYIGNTAAARAAGIETAKMKTHHYVIKTADNALFLAGFDRSLTGRIGLPWFNDSNGSLFAVYDLLGKEFGVRWLWPGELGEVIPAKKVVKLGKIDRSGKQFFIFARLRSRRFVGGQVCGWADVKNFDAYNEAENKFLLRHRVVGELYNGGAHAFTDYWRKYGKTHPEYFALLPNGKRGLTDGDPSGKYSPLCVSNGKLQDLIVRQWAKDPRRNKDNIPYQPYLIACENDSPGMCVCANCRAWDGYDITKTNNPYWSKGDHPQTRNTRFAGIANADWGEGKLRPNAPPNDLPSVSDRYCRFYLALLEKAKKIDPEARVMGYAYANYKKAPKTVRINKDIIIIFVPTGFFPFSPENARRERTAILEWKKQGMGHFIYRPNYMLAGVNLPVMFSSQVVDDFNFVGENGCVGADFDSLQGGWSAQGPMLYALCRMFVDPTRKGDEVFAEYYSGFGNAAGAIKEYFDYFQKYSDSISRKTYSRWAAEEKGGGFRNFVRISHRLFGKAQFDHAKKLLDKAEKAAAGDELAVKRVQYLKKGLRDAELTCAVRAAQSRFEKSRSNADRAAFNRAFAELKAYRASIEADFVCNYSAIGYWERVGTGWNWPLKPYKKK